MEEKKEKPADNDNSSAAVIKRGNKAIEADEKLNKKDKDPTEVKKEREKDAEQWHSEG